MAQPADLAPAIPRPSLGIAMGKGALLLGGLVAAALALRSLGTGILAATPTPAGALVLVTAGAVLTASGLPRGAVAFAGGYAFGAWRGGSLALLAQMVGCVADFWWARAIAGDWARRQVKGRLARMDRMLVARPFATTLTLRLLPFGNNLVVNLLAGIGNLPLWPFLTATLIGYVPQTAIFALAGSGVHVDRTLQLALGAALFAASTALAWLLLKRQRL